MTSLIGLSAIFVPFGVSSWTRPVKRQSEADTVVAREHDEVRGQPMRWPRRRNA
jgi:hypothetical protein